MRNSGTLPNFMIIGAMRSGTTSLSSWLRAHPQVFVSRPKEIHFFDKNYEKGPDWYRGHFAAVEVETAIGEATPKYMYFEEVPERMASVVPDARLVSILRNPVDRAYSHYWFARSRGKEKLEFVDAIREEERRLASGQRYGTYLDRGRYLRQLRNVCRYYPRDSLLVLIFEEMKAHPQETMRQLFEFLRVDSEFVPLGIDGVKNSFREFRSPLVRRILLSARRGLEFGDSKVPLPRRSLLRLLNAISPGVARLNNRESAYPPLDPGLRTSLLNEFESDNAALAQWLGKDLSIWRR